MPALRTPHAPLTAKRLWMQADGDADALSAKDAEIERLRKEMEKIQADLLAAKEVAVEQAVKATQDAAALAIEEARKQA